MVGLRPRLPRRGRPPPPPHELEGGGGVGVTAERGGAPLLRIDSLLDWHPASPGELYAEGLRNIDSTMAVADSLAAVLALGPVEFGGVLWVGGGDRSAGSGPPFFVAYRAALDTLLQAFGQDVVAGVGPRAVGPYPGAYAAARFYHVNTPVPLNHDFDPNGDSLVTIAEAAPYLDFEADVCAGHPFYSAVQASVEIR